MLASTVIFKSFSGKIWQKPFLIFSICWGFALNAAKPMEKHIQRPEMVQKLRPQRKPLIHMFWCTWLLPLNHRKTSLQSTWLRHYLQTHQRRWQGNHFSLQAIHAIFQWLPLGEKIFYQQIWCNNGIFDGAETCELVGCYLLSCLTKKYGNSIGLYRDDGLAAFNTKPQQIEKIKKGFCQIFRENDLKITVEANMTKVNFLDVTLDLPSGKHYPYTKEGSYLELMVKS